MIRPSFRNRRKMGVSFRPPFEHFRGPKNLKKSIRAEFLGVSEGLLKMEPHPGLQKERFCYYLLHLSEVQRLKKGPHFGPILGTCFVKKTKKGGSRKVLKISPPKHSKWVPNWGVLFRLLTFFGCFFHFPTLLGPTLLLERSWTSIFHFFGFVLNPKSMFLPPC